MKVYEPGLEEDLLILQWYNVLVESGDIEKAFTSRMYSVGAFMAGMRPPLILLYEADEAGIWFATWYDAVMSSLVMGLWVREDRRGKQRVSTLQESLRTAFLLSPVIVSITRSEEIIKSAKLFGFQLLGKVPYIWEGESAYIITLSKEDFERVNGV